MPYLHVNRLWVKYDVPVLIALLINIVSLSNPIQFGKLLWFILKSNELIVVAREYNF